MDIKSRFIRARDFIVQNKDNLVICAEFILVAAIFFGLGILYDKNILSDNGQISAIEPAAENRQAFVASTSTDPIRPKEKPSITKDAGAAAQTGSFVASKNGTAYYSSVCKNNIKEENKIYFQTKDDAEKAGFKPAKNCFK